MKSFASLIVAMFSTAATIFGTSVISPELTDNTVNFYQGSFESAVEKAGSEGKLFFVEFYADWCTPCKWMDKTTFRDEKVVELLNSNYVALKLDIESGEGHNMKEKYSIRMLPTILIFNSKGDMVERVEKTMSSESMISLLSYHNNPMNKLVISHDINTSPSVYTEQRGPTLDHLYDQFKIEERFRTNYKLQVGNFYNYNNAYTKVQELKAIFTEPVVVLNRYVDNTTQYKVLLGEFKTLEDARTFQNTLKTDFDIESVIY